MSEDAQDGEHDDGPSRPMRGTASRPNPFIGGSPPEEAQAEAKIAIHAPDGSIREYRLTDDVKVMYESMVEHRLSEACDWFDLWWDGTELVIEYEGHVRDNSLRPESEDLSREEMREMVNNGEQPEMDGIPKKPRKRDNGNRGRHPMMQSMMPTINLDLNDFVDPDDREELDEGILPVWNQTRIDVQERADENPLQVEDLFIKPWSNGEGQEPINSTHRDGELDDELFEVDFRDYTDDEETTVSEGARGDRWHL